MRDAESAFEKVSINRSDCMMLINDIVEEEQESHYMAVRDEACVGGQKDPVDDSEKQSQEEHRGVDSDSSSEWDK